MVRVTANPAAGLSPAQARALCETHLEQLRQDSRLPGEYRLGWLHDMPLPE
jgi:hypothetical protein